MEEDTRVLNLKKITRFYDLNLTAQNYHPSFSLMAVVSRYMWAEYGTVQTVHSE